MKNLQNYRFGRRNSPPKFTYKCCTLELNPPVKNSPDKLSEQLIKYVFNNLLSVVWTTVLVVGGVLFLGYSWAINYFPSSFDLSSTGALLAAISITGLVVTALSAFLLAIPGWFHREILCDINKSYLLNKEGKPINLILLLAMPMAIGATILWNWSQGYSWYWVLLFIVPFSISIWIRSDSLGGELEKKSKKIITSLFVVILNGIVFIFTAWLIVLQFTSKFAHDYPELEMEAWGIFGGMTLLAIVVNSIIAASGKNKWIFFAFAFALLIVTLFISRQLSLVPEASMRLLQLGGVRNATLLVDQQGCQIVRRFGIIRESSKLAPPSISAIETKDLVANIAASETCLIPSVIILSRIGPEYYLQVDLKKPSNGKQLQQELPNSTLRFVIPSSHVLSWFAQSEGGN